MSKLPELPSTLIKKNQTPEDRIRSLERRNNELERKLGDQNRKLTQILKDIAELKLVCNRLYKAGKLSRSQVLSSDTTAPAKKQSTLNHSNGLTPTKD